MSRAEVEPDRIETLRTEPLEIETRAYRLRLDPARAVAAVWGRDGGLWLRLRLLMSLDAVDGPDETLRVASVSHRTGRDRVRVEVACTSSRWRSRVTRLDCYQDRLELTGEVEGDGRLLTAHLCGGWRPPYGFLPSGSALHTVVSPNPDHPRRIARHAVEPAVIGVVGDGAEPGVGHWLFTPAPWCYAVSREPPGPDGAAPSGPWAAIGLAAPVREQTFTAFHYSGGTDGFSLRLDYEGQTTVAGRFRTPAVVVAFSQPDPYTALRHHRDLLVARGAAPGPPTGPPPSPWLQPLFCGWGAQNHLAGGTGGSPRDLATQAVYDRFLARLAAHGVIPGTVVVDDKWQREYATCRPDPAKWPDLRGWTAGRHERGQRVLLWWKAWDVEGAPPEACVRAPDGTPVALDPQTTGCRDLLDDAVGYMLGPDGLDADGLKVDFTARTPSGVALRHAGRAWGAALLHLLLGRVYRAAKAAKPDALIVTHTPNPAFADVTDMLRLNDVRMSDAPDPDGPVVPQMAYRAAVVAAACPGVPVDTDGWCLPDRAAWAEYLACQPRLGVPALYYATHIDHSGEPLSAADLAAVAESWRAYRAERGLPTPAP
jgi:hypothetical protein